MTVSGFSADFPIFLALLSASVQLPVPSDVVTTGHLASSGGDVACVASIPTKIEATLADTGARRFVLPDPKCDRSIRSLTPETLRRIEGAIATAKERIDVIGVTDIADLIRAVFSDGAIVGASLRAGFFLRTTQYCDGDVLGMAAAHLTCSNTDRFWKALSTAFFSGDNEESQRLLAAFAGLHIERRKYPTNFGRQLFQLVCSTPPAVRRLKASFPLLPTDTCIAISQFAATTDHEDIRLLYDAAHGKVVGERGARDNRDDFRDAADTASAASNLDVVLSEINAVNLARTIGLPIDDARASFALASASLDSTEEFIETVVSFYAHLLRCTNVIAGEINRNDLAGKALTLLENAFAKHGGFDAAAAEARYATRGGMRWVLDIMAESYKQTEQRAFVDLVLRESVDALSWDESVAFMSSLMERLGKDLPDDIRSQPPERYAKSWDAIVRAYVRSFDGVQALMRSL